jgi:hypothetical protein
VLDNNYNKCLTVISALVKMLGCLPPCFLAKARMGAAQIGRKKINPARKGVDYGK